MSSSRQWAVGLAVVGLLAACTAGGRHPSSTAARTRPADHPAPSGTATPSPSSPRDQVEGARASWVREENARTGTNAWAIPAHAPTAIAGFADRTYAAEGDAVALYVSTPAPSFSVEAYRMGYYGGAGGRLVWQSGSVPGVAQPRCPRVSSVNLVACDTWRQSMTLPLTSDFLPGDYLLKLVGSGGQQSYVPLTVWDPDSHAALLIKNDVLTWQAWNAFGGYDFYAGPGSCGPDEYPLCSRARIVSFDRPDIGNGAPDFVAIELPLVRFVEQQGLDVSYATDVTLIEHPSFLLQHKALLSLGHDECWELTERRAAVTAHRAGVNIAFFAASPMLRHVRLRASRLGPDREVVDYRDPSEDPLDGHGKPLEVTSNTWASPPASWPEDTFVGDSYAGYLEPDARPATFVVADARAWIFAGTGAHNGTAVPGVIASDVDGVNPAAAPANLQVFGHSPVSAADSQTNQTWGSLYYSDMTYYTDPAGRAAVFDSGTNNWIPSLTECPARTRACPAAFVRRVTLNLLLVLAAGPAGRQHPSHANWQHFAPYNGQ